MCSCECESRFLQVFCSCVRTLFRFGSLLDLTSMDQQAMMQVLMQNLTAMVQMQVGSPASGWSPVGQPQFAGNPQLQLPETSHTNGGQTDLGVESTTVVNPAASPSAGTLGVGMAPGAANLMMAQMAAMVSRAAVGGNGESSGASGSVPALPHASGKKRETSRSRSLSPVTPGNKT